MTQNQIICGKKYGNLGTSNCAFDLDQINGLIVTDESKSYTMSTYATPLAFLTALGVDSLLDSPAQRIFPYMRVIGGVDGTPANAVTATPYGIHQKSDVGRPMLTLTLAERGLHQVQSFSRFNGNNGIRYFISMKNGGLIGESKYDGTFAGFRGTIDAEGKLFPEGTGVGVKAINLRFDDQDALLNPAKLGFYMFEDANALKDGLGGVHDVKIEAVSAAVAAIVLTIQRADNLKDLGIDYSTALTQAGAYTVAVASSGVAAVPSSVTYNAITGKFTLAFSPSLSAVPYVVTLKGPTVLAALSPAPFGNAITGGFESNVLTVTPTA